MRCPADHMLISRRSFMFTLEHVNIRMNELFCFERTSSFVHSKKYKENYKTKRELNKVWNNLPLRKKEP